MGIDKETVKLATGHEDTKMIDEVYLHESSEDKARKLSGAIKDKAKGSLFVANNSQKPEFTEEEIDVFNYVFAGDLLLGINQNMKRPRYMRFWIRIWIPVFWNYLQRKKLSPF